MDTVCSVRGLTLLVAIPALLAGCTNTPVPLDSEAHNQLIERDRSDKAAYENQTIELDLKQAIERAVANNLDARVAEYQVLSQKRDVTVRELEALPSLRTSRGVTERSNVGASSSMSVISGLQSLEPSQSTDRRRLVTEMSASWNMMDAVVTLVDADRMKTETSIAGTRYAKVVQNIERDVYAAYWRAYAYGNSNRQTTALLNEARSQIKKYETAAGRNNISVDEVGQKIAEISGRMRTLQETNVRIASSESELKALLNYPQSVRLELKRPPQNLDAIRSVMKSGIIDQEWAALKARPEMREEVLQKNAAINNIHQEILKTFPGLELLANNHYDSNSFLEDHSWNDYSVSIVQNVLNIFTLPARFQAAEEKENLGDVRRSALNAAIVAQVNLGKLRLHQSWEAWNDSREITNMAQKSAKAKQAKASAGFVSGADVLNTRMDAQIETLRGSMAMADLQDAYAAMVNTMGQELDPSSLEPRTITAREVTP